MAKLSPVGISAQFINGIPANGAKMFFYAANSSTKQDTFTDSGGLTANPNPIILNSRGELPNEAWLTEGLAYKVVFAPSTDTDPPTSPIWDVDNVTGVNDASLTIDQWVNSGLIPTYVSATSFTVPGDQTSVFTNKRRLKSTVTAGTAYSTVLSSVFGALTTVTVVNDSTPLDAGLSSVQLGLITLANTSIPSIVESFRATVAATATTTPLWVSTAQVQDWTASPTITDFPDAPQAGVWREVYPTVGTVFTDNANIDVQGDDNYTVAAGDKIYIEALTISTFKVWISKKSGEATVLQSIPSKIQPLTASVGSNALTITLNPTVLDFRSATLTSGTVNTRTVGAAISVVVSSGSTLGTVSATQSRLAVLAIDNSGTVELAVSNMAGGVSLDETGIISTTAEGGAGAADSATVIYSTTARSNVPYRVVGYIESTQATAGTWATAPSTIQGAGGQSLSSFVGLGNNQPWQDLTASRAQNTTYTNTTGRAIAITGYLTCTTANNFQVQLNGNIMTFQSVILSGVAGFSLIVPHGQTYLINPGGANFNLTKWWELRS